MTVTPSETVAGCCWNPAATRKKLKGDPARSHRSPPSHIPSPLRLETIELSLAPTIQPRAASHQEQGQKELSNQRQSRHRRRANDIHPEPVAVADIDTFRRVVRELPGLGNSYRRPSGPGRCRTWPPAAQSCCRRGRRRRWPSISSSISPSCMRETMASPSTISFTIFTSPAFLPSATSTVLVEPPSSMVTSVGENERVGYASSLSMPIVSGAPIDMSPYCGLSSTRFDGRIVSVIRGIYDTGPVSASLYP